MNKREYAKANLDWLAEKAKEEGVNAFQEEYTIRCCRKATMTASTPPHAASSRHTIPDEP